MPEPVTIRTLGDLGDLGVQCQACWRFVDLDRAELGERYGAGLDLGELNRRLRCGRCGSRHTLLFRGYDAGGYRCGELTSDG